MEQTKKQSLLESATNTAVGFIISLASTFVIFPLVGFESSFSKNLIVTLFFTIVSILRGYFIRRFFNKVAYKK
jgi:predicted membrane protein